MTTTLDTFQSLFNGNTKNKSYRTDSGKVHTIDWNVDGSRLASGSLDKSVVIFAYDGKGSMVGKGFKERMRHKECRSLHYDLIYVFDR
jgi:WD40 repeat protein